MGRSNETALRYGSADETREKRRRFHGTRLELRVILHRDKPGMLFELDDLWQYAIRRHAGEGHTMLLKRLYIGCIDLVAVTLALLNAL